MRRSDTSTRWSALMVMSAAMLAFATVTAASVSPVRAQLEPPRE